MITKGGHVTNTWQTRTRHKHVTDLFFTLRFIESPSRVDLPSVWIGTTTTGCWVNLGGHVRYMTVVLHIGPIYLGLYEWMVSLVSLSIRPPGNLHHWGRRNLAGSLQNKTFSKSPLKPNIKCKITQNILQGTVKQTSITLVYFTVT